MGIQSDKIMIELIAKQHLFVDTLETRNVDSLDFKNCHVASIKSALEAAFALGRASAQELL